MNGTRPAAITCGARFVAVLLMVGGILGILVSVQKAVHFTHEHRPGRVAVAVLSIPVFTWCVLTGVTLWRRKPRGYRWAKLLFVLEIPAFSFSHLSYEFSTGMSARILFGNSNRRFGADIGSSLNFLISPEPLGGMLGINLVAVAVVIFLFAATRNSGA